MYVNKEVESIFLVYAVECAFLYLFLLKSDSVYNRIGMHSFIIIYHLCNETSLI